MYAGIFVSKSIFCQSALKWNTLIGITKTITLYLSFSLVPNDPKRENGQICLQLALLAGNFGTTPNLIAFKQFF